MSKSKILKFDEIGYWSEIKLEIIKSYAEAYSRILAAQCRKGIRLRHVYIDGFAGAGRHRSKSTGEMIPGSPQIALDVRPRFAEYHFIDLEKTKTDYLEKIAAGQPDVHIYPGDCNQILTRDVFPIVRYDQYRRGLCLLDPYGLHLRWNVIRAAAETRAIEIFLNFPVADMNRNVFWRNPEGVSPEDRERMNSFWGDESWRKVAYVPVPTLFGEEEEKVENRAIAEGFRQRLIKDAGFGFVPEPVPMRNSKNAVVYYLFFASHNRTGEKIVKAIFEKYRRYGIR